jgi:cytochrome c oxidase subunit 4
MPEQELPFTEFKSRTYAVVWLCLLMLTAATVAVARFHWTEYPVFVPIAIATIKSGLVVTYFMHLKDEPWIVKVMLFLALLALALIILLTFTDVSFREGGHART